MEQLARTLPGRNLQQLPTVRLASINKARKGYLSPLSNNEDEENCKTCKEKEAFIKSLQSEIFRLQVLANDLSYQLILRGQKPESPSLPRSDSEQKRCLVCNSIIQSKGLEETPSPLKGLPQKGGKLAPIEHKPEKMQESSANLPIKLLKTVKHTVLSSTPSSVKKY